MGYSLRGVPHLRLRRDNDQLDMEFVVYRPHT